MTGVGLLIISALAIISCHFGMIEGQTITPVYVQSNAPVTLTCPADDQATTLTWTGPGGTLYVSGTTVEAGLDDGVKPRISARHTGGSYTLTFTEFRSSDTGIYTCTVDWTVDLQVVVVQGVMSSSPVYTRQGGTVILQCPDTDTDGLKQWTVTSLTFIYAIGTNVNPAIPDDTRTRLSVTRKDGTYNIKISDVQLSDVREYRCQIGGTYTLYHLLLYIPPTFPEVQNTVSIDGKNRLTGTEDGSMTLTCNALGGTPAASVSWIKDGTTLVTSVNTVQYTKVFTRADDRTVYTCQSSSPVLTSPQTTSVLVYLDLKPRQPSISDQLSQAENTNLQVACVSTGSRPAAIIQWNVGGTWQSNNPTEVNVKDSATVTYIVTSTLLLPVIRQDNGKSVYCRASNQALSGGIESVRRSITVLYPPDIHVSYTNTTYTSTDTVLTCVPDGKPETYQFGQWRQKAEDGTEIRQLTGSSSPLQSVLTLPDPGVTKRYEDTGYYVCEASNNIPDSSFYSSGSVFFVVEAPPVLITNTTVVKGQIQDNVSIEVEFYSKPAVNPRDITWTRVSDRLPLTDRSAASLDVRNVLMSFHGVDVQVKGYVAVLKITTLVEGDFGDYTVTIENSQGKGNYTFVFEYANPPLPPGNEEILVYDSSSITIQWTPSFDGGAEQEFVIGYKSDVFEDFVDLAPIPDTHESTQSYQITGLKPGTTHFLRIYAENQLGHSDFVFLNQTTAVGEEGPSIGPLVGGIAGSALGLIAIAVIAVVIYKRRSSAKDGLKANVMYESAGANFQPQPGPSSEYAIVCKPNKKKGAAVDPNSVYDVVDKSSKDKKDSNDVYAEVVTQPKEKGGKGGDEYENIITDKAANSNNTTKVDLTSSRKQNQDGLLYLDVEFKDNSNSERRAMIHGIENRTDYADVDFTQRADPVPSQTERVEKNEETSK